MLTLARFAAEQGTSRKSAIQLDRRIQELHLRVTISGCRLPETCHLFNGSPSMGDLQDWNVDAKLSA